MPRPSLLAPLLVLGCSVVCALGSRSVDWPITADRFTGINTYEIANKSQGHGVAQSGFPSWRFGVDGKYQSIGFAGDFVGLRHVVPGFTFTWYICLNDTTGYFGNTTGCQYFPDPGCYTDSKLLWGADSVWKNTGDGPTEQLSYYNTTFSTSKKTGRQAVGSTVVFADGDKTPYFMRKVKINHEGVSTDEIQMEFDLEGVPDEYFKVPSYLSCSHHQEGVLAGKRFYA